VVAALSVDLVRLVRHVLHEEIGPDSYNQLRASLMASHSLSNYQKMGEDDAAAAVGRLQVFSDVGRNVRVLPGWRIFHCRFRLPFPSAAASREKFPSV
jgi:hypothetical protein